MYIACAKLCLCCGLDRLFVWYLVHAPRAIHFRGISRHCSPGSRCRDAHDHGCHSVPGISVWSVLLCTYGGARGKKKREALSHISRSFAHSFARSLIHWVKGISYVHINNERPCRNVSIMHIGGLLEWSCNIMQRRRRGQDNDEAGKEPVRSDRHGHAAACQRDAYRCYGAWRG